MPEAISLPEPDAPKLATDPGDHHQSWCGGKQPCVCPEMWKAGGWRDYLPENDPAYQAGYAAGLRTARDLVPHTWHTITAGHAHAPNECGRCRVNAALAVRDNA